MFKKFLVVLFGITLLSNHSYCCDVDIFNETNTSIVNRFQKFVSWIREIPNGFIKKQSFSSQNNKLETLSDLNTNINFTRIRLNKTIDNMKDSNNQNECLDLRRNRRTRLRKLFEKEREEINMKHKELNVSSSSYKQNPTDFNNCININDHKNMEIINEISDYTGLMVGSEYSCCLNQSVENDNNATLEDNIDTDSNSSKKSSSSTSSDTIPLNETELNYSIKNP